MKIKESNLTVIKEAQALQSRIKKLILDSTIRGINFEETRLIASALVLRFTEQYNPIYRAKLRSIFAKSFYDWSNITQQAVRELLPPRASPRQQLIRIEPDITTERGDLWESDQAYKKRVKKAYKRIVSELADAEPTDENGRKISVRWMAEVEARHEAYEERLTELTEQGENLVWVSSHANASKRCARWQGRLYSLNHTTGTINGIPYEPLENAVEIYVTTKSGKQYRNGLFGFNCRHDIYPYRVGSRAPKEFTPRTMNKERQIDKTMREMELEIRRAKTIAYLTPVREEKASATELASNLMEKYKSFCDSNERSWSLNRTTVITEELEQARLTGLVQE